MATLVCVCTDARASLNSYFSPYCSHFYYFLILRGGCLGLSGE